MQIQRINKMVINKHHFLCFLEKKKKKKKLQVIAFLLASGVGAGFAVTFEFKRTFGDLLVGQENKFLNKGIMSTGLLLIGFAFMALLTIYSSNRRSSSTQKGFFK